MKRKIYFTALALLISMVPDVNGMYWPYNGVGGDGFGCLAVPPGIAPYLNGFDASGAASAMGPQSMQYTGASANTGLYNVQTLYAAVPAMVHQEMPAQVPVASNAQPAPSIAPSAGPQGMQYPTGPADSFYYGDLFANGDVPSAGPQGMQYPTGPADSFYYGDLFANGDVPSAEFQMQYPAGPANSFYYGDLPAHAMEPQSMQYTDASANEYFYNNAAVPAMVHQEMPAQVPVASSAQPALSAGPANSFYYGDLPASIFAPPPPAPLNEALGVQLDARTLEIIGQIDTGERPILREGNIVYVPRFMTLEVLKQLFLLRWKITVINVVYNNSIVHVLNVLNYVPNGKHKSPVLIPWVNKERNRCNLFDILSSHKIVAQYFRYYGGYNSLFKYIKHSTDILDKFLLAECPFVADNLNEIQERVSADGKSLFIPYLLNGQQLGALLDKMRQRVHEVYLHIPDSKLCLYIKEGSNLGFAHWEQMKTFTLFVQNVEVVPALLLSLQLYRIVNSGNNEDRRIYRKVFSKTFKRLFPEIANAHSAPGAASSAKPRRKRKRLADSASTASNAHSASSTSAPEER